MLLAAGFFSYTTSRNIGDAVLFTISPQWYFALVTFGFLLTLFGIVAGGKYLAFVARKFLALIGIRPKRRPPRSQALPQPKPFVINPTRDLIALICLVAGPLLLYAFFNIRGNTVIVRPDRFSIHKFNLWSSPTDLEFTYASIQNLDVETKRHLKRTPTQTVVLRTDSGEQRLPMTLELRAALPLIKERRLSPPPP